MSLNLTQTDVITRLRRWAGVVGLASPNSTDEVQLDATLANLTVDPYQQEYDEFSSFISSGAVAASLSYAGITNGGTNPGCGVCLVDRIDFSTATAQGFTVLLNRNQSVTAGSNWPGAPNGVNAYNQGFPKGFPTGKLQARVSQVVGAATPPGGTQLFQQINVPVNTVQSWIPPYPIQLYGPATPTTFGDMLVVQGATVNTGMFLTIYWREWPTFRF